jgi:hypothetical protein
MGDTILRALYFETLTCYKCGYTFAVPQAAHRRLVEQGEVFFCPNGHSQCFTKSEVQRLREQVEAINRKNVELVARNASLGRDYDAQVEKRYAAEKLAKFQRTLRVKQRARVQNGVCPCCNRHFVNLERHMHTKHPGKDE